MSTSQFSKRRSSCIALVLTTLVLSSFLTASLMAQQETLISLRDFSREEVKGMGLTISRPVTFTVTALGGGSKISWDDRDEAEGERGSDMFAAAWIIDAKTREIVWEMTPENTSGSTKRRSAETELKLKPGSYEVYFAAYGYSRRSSLVNFNVNIDRRDSPQANRHKGIGDFFKELFGFGDEFYEEFMDLARNEWGVTVTAGEADRPAITTFSAPMTDPHTIATLVATKDHASIRTTLTLSREMDLVIYALGEGRQNDDLFDFGWITNVDTRERVWEMRLRDSHHAGGAAKNVCVQTDLRLPKGTYEIVYVTDDSHSPIDWNSMPPSDPFRYGITVAVKDPSDLKSAAITDAPSVEKNVIVALTKMRDDELRSAGFSLSSKMKVRVYALGESSGHEEMADYGWIINTRTRERVWSMDERESDHAGGASKNRMVDEIITLPKGEYMVYYQTDDSHSYEDWNDDAPYDPTHWGITISGVGEGFDPTTVKTFTDVPEDDVIVQIIRVKDDRHSRKSFSLDARTKIRVYAIGEGVGNDMADYGWIENTRSGETVWEMTSDMTEHAGGARKNRMVDQTIVLDKGEYEVHFETDGSHAYGEWNDAPPHDPTHWGISLYKEE